MAEQSPYDEGNLWCRVGSAAYFDTKINDKALYTAAQEAITNHSLAPSFERNARVSFYGAAQLPCQVNIYTGNEAKSPIHGFKGNGMAEASLIVFCSNRTKEAYYGQL